MCLHVNYTCTITHIWTSTICLLLSIYWHDLFGISTGSSDRVCVWVVLTYRLSCLSSNSVCFTPVNPHWIWCSCYAQTQYNIIRYPCWVHCINLLLPLGTKLAIWVKWTHDICYWVQHRYSLHFWNLNYNIHLSGKAINIFTIVLLDRPGMRLKLASFPVDEPGNGASWSATDATSA